MFSTSRKSFKLTFLPSDESTASPTPHPRPHTQSPPPVCQSPQCIHAASEILYNLDSNYTNIDPCSDFDQYVCGGWRERHDMRSDQGSIFAGTIMAENAQTRLRHILERSEAPNSADTDNFAKLKAAYTACLDESIIRKRGSEPLEEVLTELSKVYPVKSGLVSGTQDHLTNAILFLMKSGVEALVSQSISVSYFAYLIQPLQFKANKFSLMIVTLITWPFLCHRLERLVCLQESTTTIPRRWLNILLR